MAGKKYFSISKHTMSKIRRIVRLSGAKGRGSKAKYYAFNLAQNGNPENGTYFENDLKLDRFMGYMDIGSDAFFANNMVTYQKYADAGDPFKILLKSESSKYPVGLSDAVNSLNENSIVVQRLDESADIVSDYFTGKISMKQLIRKAGGISQVANKRELEVFLRNKFMLKWKADELGVKESQIASKVKQLIDKYEDFFKASRSVKAAYESKEGVSLFFEMMMDDDDPDMNDLDSFGMDANTQKRLRVKKMHQIKGKKKVRRPSRTHLPFSLR